MFFLFRSLRWELVSGDVIEGHEMREVCGAKGGGELRAENHRRRQLDVKTGKHLTNRVREVCGTSGIGSVFRCKKHEGRQRRTYTYSTNATMCPLDKRP